MSDILTDVKLLRKKSDTINDDLEINQIVKELISSIPVNVLGLSSPQIGIYKRIFIANLSQGSYAFVNPEIIWASSGKVPSIEACLSLPRIQRCINRHDQIKIYCSKIINIKKDVIIDFKLMRLKDQDAFIIQHEYDHLCGKLIIDHPKILTKDEQYFKRQDKRIQKIKSNRLKNKQKSVSIKSKKLGPKQIAKVKLQAQKQKRLARTARRQAKISVEIQERYLAEKENLFDFHKNPFVGSKITKFQK